MQAISQFAGGVTPVNIVVYCRAGEKRSVSIAWLLAKCLQQHARGEMVEPINHMGALNWARWTCAGFECVECDLSSARHASLVETLESHSIIDF